MNAPSRREQIEAAFPTLDELSDELLAEQCVRAWDLGLERGGWRDIHDIPYAWNIDDVSTVEHVQGVAQIALTAIEQQERIHGAPIDRDVVIAGALLHDVGKCYEYTSHVPNDRLDSPSPTYAGDVIPHSLSSYALAHEVGCSIAVKRTIPHFLGEIPTRSIEAELITSANAISSNAITQATMGISLPEWVERYSQTQN
ncbi:HD domain-containing protein [Halocatena halophila]|uniref:HD domain-containing protein n=1 Tax=Halocatena halophila TaxID=2814576 RepID=UPI002ED21618